MFLSFSVAYMFPQEVDDPRSYCYRVVPLKQDNVHSLKIAPEN